VRARAVVLCASTIESVRLLLLSAAAGHAAGLGNRSGALGRYLMDHCMVYASGPAARDPAFDAEPADPYDHGRIHGFYLPRFRNLGKRDAAFLRGYGILGGIGRGRPAWSMVGFGEVLARPENRVTLDPARRDAWGLPAARIEYGHGPNERAMIADMRRALAELARSGGLRSGTPGGSLLGRLALRLARRRLFTRDGALVPGSSNHEVGGARMGDDPATSVLDPWNRLWDVPNVLVTDGAAFVSSGYQNVTLTILALTARACGHLVEELGGRR
jgi:choline dehydrogenase-like flavoprotein